MKPARKDRDDRQLTWAEMPPLLRAMVVLVILEVIFLATALYLGVGGDGRGSVGDVVRDVLGRGEVRSEAWLRVAWLMPVVIAVTLFVAWWAGSRWERGASADQGASAMCCTLDGHTLRR